MEHFRTYIDLMNENVVETPVYEEITDIVTELDVLDPKKAAADARAKAGKDAEPEQKEKVLVTNWQLVAKGQKMIVKGNAKGGQFKSSSVVKMDLDGPRPYVVTKSGSIYYLAR